MMGLLATVLAVTNGDGSGAWHTILWLVAAALVIYGIFVIVARQAILLGIVLIVLGLLVGPGGVSLFS